MRLWCLLSLLLEVLIEAMWIFDSRIFEIPRNFVTYSEIFLICFGIFVKCSGITLNMYWNFNMLWNLLNIYILKMFKAEGRFPI